MISLIGRRRRRWVEIWVQVASAQEKPGLVEQLEVAAGPEPGVGVAGVVLGFGRPGGSSVVRLGEQVAMERQRLVVQGKVWMLAQHSVQVWWLWQELAKKQMGLRIMWVKQWRVLWDARRVWREG
jgi:hypothetical protein